MNATIHIRLAAAMLAAWILSASYGAAEASSRLSSRFLARGEKTFLQVAISGAEPSAFPEIPKVKGIDIQLANQGARPQQLPGRTVEYVFDYLISSYDVGDHVLPSIEVMAGGAKLRTEPVEFKVFNPDDLKWSDAVSGDTKFRYASSFRVTNPTPYDGETTPVEIKLYVPQDLFVQDWGIPDFQRDGLTSWRYQPSPMLGSINLLGIPYVSVSYPSTLTSTRLGKIAIGPATVRLMTTRVIMDGFLRRVPEEVHLDVPKLELETKALPPDAPEGFENAIGSFKMDVRSSMTELQESDPVPVEIEVSGSGNLDSIRPPRPVDATGWKLYETTTEPRGDERRELSGKTVFRQFLRPLEFKPAIPAFRLVYFDPKEKAYKTLLSQPIPLKMLPSKTASIESITPPPALAMPVEKMTDILGVLASAALTMENRPTIPPWSGHVLAALIALGLIAKALWMRYGHRFERDPIRAVRVSQLRQIERLPIQDDEGFLTSVGRFIERWHGANPSPEIKSVLAERDDLCFRPEKSNTVMPPGRRTEILRLLRKASLLCILGFLTTAESTRAAETKNPALEAYQSARYDEAIKLWLSAAPYDQLAPDTLYNIGNACYRAGSPGQAALYYRRALARDPGHLESRQNLRFIERKHGSFTVARPEYQDILSRLSLSTWKGIVWTGAWLCLLAILVFPATRSGATIRIAAFASLVAAPLIAACGALGWYHYPDDSEFAPLARQAVIVNEKTVLHVEASRTSAEVIDAPPGSLCEIVRRSGRWAYVSFATKTRGWVPAEALEPIIPTTPPVPPTIHKPKADGKSA